MSKPRILLADDHALVRAGVRSILETEFEIAGEVEDGMELVKAAIKLDRLDVIIVDISMPNLNGLEAISTLRKRGVRAKIIVLTMHSGIDFVVQALRLGVSGYVLKVDAAEELTRAVSDVLAGGRYISPDIAEDVMTLLMESSNKLDEIISPWEKLTSRERVVLQLIAEGHTMPKIADILNISARTVERHRYSLMDKLKLRTTAELTQYAFTHGLISPP